MAFHPKMLDAARQPEGEPMVMLRDLARQHQGVVGGSFIAMRGESAYNTFALAFPDGSVFFHDKEQPTMSENCYYTGGDHGGVLDTRAVGVGEWLCWVVLMDRAGTPTC